MPRPANSLCNKYIGLSEEEANRRIKADGLTPRLIGKDGEQFFGTCDVRLDRVNLTVAADRVVAADIG